MMGFIGGAIVIAVLLAGCSDNSQEWPQYREGSVLVKICNDGSRIYRLKDGRAVTAGDIPVEDGNTVCDNSCRP